MLGPQPFHIRHGTASPSKRLLHKSCTERTLEGTAESPFHSQCRWAEQDAAATGNLLSTIRHILVPRGNAPLLLRSRRSARNRAKNGDYHGKKIGKKGLDRPERLRPSRTTWDPTRCSLLLHKSCTERTLKGMARSPFDSQRRWPKQDAGATSMGKLLSTTWRFSNAHKDLRGIAPRTATTTAARPAR